MPRIDHQQTVRNDDLGGFHDGVGKGQGYRTTIHGREIVLGITVTKVGEGGRAGSPVQGPVAVGESRGDSRRTHIVRDQRSCRISHLDGDVVRRARITGTGQGHPEGAGQDAHAGFCRGHHAVKGIVGIQHDGAGILMGQFKTDGTRIRERKGVGGLAVAGKGAVVDRGISGRTLPPESIGTVRGQGDSARITGNREAALVHHGQRGIGGGAVIARTGSRENELAQVEHQRVVGPLLDIVHARIGDVEGDGGGWLVVQPEGGNAAFTRIECIREIAVRQRRKCADGAFRRPDPGGRRGGHRNGFGVARHGGRQRDDLIRACRCVTVMRYDKSAARNFEIVFGQQRIHGGLDIVEDVEVDAGIHAHMREAQDCGAGIEAVELVCGIAISQGSQDTVRFTAHCRPGTCCSRGIDGDCPRVSGAHSRAIRLDGGNENLLVARCQAGAMGAVMGDGESAQGTGELLVDTLRMRVLCDQAGSIVGNIDIERTRNGGGIIERGHSVVAGDKGIAEIPVARAVIDERAGIGCRVYRPVTIGGSDVHLAGKIGDRSTAGADGCNRDCRYRAG